MNDKPGLRLVTADKDSEEIDLDAVERSIRRIYRAQLERRVSGFGPRTQRALGFSAVTVVLFLLLRVASDKLGFTLDERLAVYLNSVFLAALLGFCVCIYFAHFSSTPSTWSEKIDRLLAEHEPIDRVAYRNLQQTVHDCQYLSDDALSEWIYSEKRAIRLLRGEGDVPRKNTFLNRKV